MTNQAALIAFVEETEVLLGILKNECIPEVNAFTTYSVAFLSKKDAAEVQARRRQLFDDTLSSIQTLQGKLSQACTEIKSFKKTELDGSQLSQDYDDKLYGYLLETRSLRDNLLAFFPFVEKYTILDSGVNDCIGSASSSNSTSALDLDLDDLLGYSQSTANPDLDELLGSSSTSKASSEPTKIFSDSFFDRLLDDDGFLDQILDTDSNKKPVSGKTEKPHEVDLLFGTSENNNTHPGFFSSTPRCPLGPQESAESKTEAMAALL